MNIEKVIASLKDCSAEELEQVNQAVQDARLNQYRKHYNRITTYFSDALQQVGEANFGVVVRDSYDNEVILYRPNLERNPLLLKFTIRKTKISGAMN